MSVTSIYRWHDGALDPLEWAHAAGSERRASAGRPCSGDCDMTLTVIEAADSFLVSNGTVLGIGLHRERFLGSIPPQYSVELEPEAFWDAALALLPREGDWFPRFELHSTQGALRLVFRLRSAPELNRSVRVATWPGDDPRTAPTIKGPDLERLTRVRTAVQQRGADEAVLLSPDGYLIEGAVTALLWWRGDILCGPPPELERVDSVTARSILTLATALGIDTFEESVTPPELDGTELWAVNSLHGIRIVTEWIDGPSLAEQPGRLAAWRKRLDALRRPL